MQDSPAVALLLANELQALLKGRVRDRVDVVGEESADKEGATLFEMLNIGGEVGDDDVAMDVGNDEVELSFDGRGNYALGLKEQLIFPEIEYDKVDKVRGMDVVFVTTAHTDEEARELLRLFGMPYTK